MQVYEAIEKRKSTRNFDGRCVDRTHLEQIIQAGLKAPRMGKLNVFVVEDPDILDRIDKAAYVNTRKFNVHRLNDRFNDPSRSLLHGSGTMLLFTGDSFNPMSPINAGAAIENMILTAAEFGIDSCCACSPANAFLFDTEAELKELLGISSGENVNCALLLGYRISDEDVWPWDTDDVAPPAVKFL